MEEKISGDAEGNENEIVIVLRGQTASELMEAAREKGISPSALVIHLVLDYLESEPDDESDGDESEDDEDNVDVGDEEPEDQ